MDRAFSRRKPSNPRIQHNYFIERKDSPGEPLDQDLLLTTIDVNEFYIVRENSRRKVEEHEEEENSRYYYSLIFLLLKNTEKLCKFQIF